jgi:glycosyltransferase involved in cell wall biosynthesis
MVKSMSNRKIGLNRICHISVLHRPDDTRIFYKECQSLHKAGYEVYYIVPNCEGKNFNGVHIVSTMRLRNRLVRFTLLQFDVLIKSLRLNCKVYHFHDPELIFVGILLRFLKKIVIYDVHEDLSLQIYNKLWIPKYLKKALSVIASFIETQISRKLDHTIVSTPSIEKRFKQNNVTIIQNSPIVKTKNSIDSINYQNRKNIIVYIGSISKKRGIIEMIDILNLLNEKLDCKLAIAGNFNDKNLESNVISLPSWKQHVEFFGWVNRNDINRLLSKARIGLTLLHPCPNYLESYPVKLFEYMCAGVPVIASNFALWDEIITEAGCGYTIDPFDINGIVNILEFVLNNEEKAYEMGRKGRKFVEDRFNWDKEAEKLLRIYNSFNVT